jgi:hypothetical protein
VSRSPVDGPLVMLGCLCGAVIEYLLSSHFGLELTWYPEWRRTDDSQLTNWRLARYATSVHPVVVCLVMLRGHMHDLVQCPGHMGVVLMMLRCGMGMEMESTTRSPTASGVLIIDRQLGYTK